MSEDWLPTTADAGSVDWRPPASPSPVARGAETEGLGVHRVGYVPVKTPGNVAVTDHGVVTASGRSCHCGAALPPSASINARRTTSCTNDCSRNRTSALVGWTFTSTASAGISINRWTSGLRSLIVATL